MIEQCRADRKQSGRERGGGGQDLEKQGNDGEPHQKMAVQHLIIKVQKNSDVNAS